MNKDSIRQSAKMNQIELNNNLPSKINNKNISKVGHSVESNCGQYILKEYIKNVKKSFLNVLSKMENDESCISCQNDNDNHFDPVDFNINLSKFKLFKTASHFYKQSYGKSKYMFII